MAEFGGRDFEPRRDNQDPELFGPSPSQTVGPFFHYGLPWKGGADLVTGSPLGARPDLFPEEHWVLHIAEPHAAARGEVIELTGRVLDASGQPLPDAMLEIWQANANGRYASDRDPRHDLPIEKGFSGFGRAATADDGTYRFRTIVPGAVPGPDGQLQAPHIAMSVFGRGLIKRLVTRVYFAGNPANEKDLVLSLVPAERRATLLATPDGARWNLDIVLQGERETVFFDI